MNAINFKYSCAYIDLAIIDAIMIIDLEDRSFDLHRRTIDPNHLGICFLTSRHLIDKHKHTRWPSPKDHHLQLMALKNLSSE